MKIDYHRPAEKGVTQLMYVGDDGTMPSSSTKWWVLAGMFVLGWWFGKRK